MLTKSSLLWVQDAKPSKKPSTTSTPAVRNSVWSKSAFTVRSLSNISLMQSPQASKKLLSSTAAKNPVHTANPSISMSKQLSLTKTLPSSAAVTVSPAKNSPPQWSMPSTNILTANAPQTSLSVSTTTSATSLCPSTKSSLPNLPVQPHVCSGVSVLTVLSVPTKTPSKSSVTTLTNMFRLTSHTTQRNPAVSQFPTSVSVMFRSSLPI